LLSPAAIDYFGALRADRGSDRRTRREGEAVSA
jgi:hypothetical protein